MVIKQEYYFDVKLKKLVLIIVLVFMLLLTACTAKDDTATEPSASLSAVRAELEIIKVQNAELQKQLKELREQNSFLELQLKEREGLLPHQGIGEVWIEGTVLEVDEEKRMLTIDQHFDDNSIKVDPQIYVLPAATIQQRIVDLSYPNKILEVKNRMGKLSESIQSGDTISLVYRINDSVAKFVSIDIMQNTE